MSPSYPYPTIDRDGFEIAVIEQGDRTRALASPLPAENERFGAKPGDLVKAVFVYREPDRRDNGAVIGSEHMWVKIIDQGVGCLIGELDSDPRHTSLLKSGDRISLHPKHIIAFWKE